MNSDLVNLNHLETATRATKQFVTNSLSSIQGGANLSTVPSSVEGSMWFETVNDSPVIKFFHDSKEFSFAQNYSLATDATISGNVISIGDKSFTVSGLADNLTLFGGKFYLPSDTNHQNPLGDIVTYFDNGVLTSFCITFRSFAVLSSRAERYSSCYLD